MTTTGLRRSAAGLVAAGAALFAVGNLIHPLEHSDEAHTATTWVAAHLTFGLGGLLLAVGLPLLLATGTLTRPSRLVPVAGLLLAVGFAGLAPSAWFEAYVAPLPGGVAEQLESGPGGTVNAVLGFAWLLGSLGYGIGLARRGLAGPVRGAGVALILATIAMLVVPGLPGPEGVWIIPGTVIVAAAHAITAAVAARSPLPAAQPGSPVALVH